MGLPEILFGMALLLTLAAPALWWAVPVVIFGYALVRKAEDVSNDVRDTSAPGSGCALVSGVLTIALAGGVVLLALLAVGVAGGAI